MQRDRFWEISCRSLLSETRAIARLMSTNEGVDAEDCRLAADAIIGLMEHGLKIIGSIEYDGIDGNI
jgi:hypothetical protein